MIKNKIRFLTILTISSIIAGSFASVTEAAVSRPFAGVNRFDTGLKIIASGWTKNDSAVLSAGNNGNLVDALTAAPLAKKLKAPIFLISGATLDKDTAATIKAMGVKNIYITSGTGVIGTDIESQLKSMGISNVIRLGGADRYETSVNIANAVGTKGKIMVARGDEYADALSAAAIAAKEGIPILLSSRDSLPDTVNDYILKKKINETYVLGLQGAISDSVASKLPGAKRLGGSNRYETNVSIIKEFEDGLDFSKAYVASGESANLVDALAGSPLAAQYSAPIVLTSTALSDTTADYLSTVLNPDSDIEIFGGQAAVPSSVSDRLTAIENSISTETSSGTASVKNMELPILKQITVSSTAISGCSKFRVQGSSSIVELGKAITLIPADGKLTIYLYSESGEIMGRGILDVSKSSDSLKFTIRLVK